MSIFHNSSKKIKQAKKYLHNQLLQGEISVINSDGSYNVTVLGRSYPFLQVNQMVIETNLQVGDQVNIGFMDGDSHKPFIYNLSNIKGVGVTTIEINPLPSPDIWLFVGHDQNRTWRSPNQLNLSLTKKWEPLFSNISITGKLCYINNNGVYEEVLVQVREDTENEIFCRIYNLVTETIVDTEILDKTLFEHDREEEFIDEEGHVHLLAANVPEYRIFYYKDKVYLFIHTFSYYEEPPEGYIWAGSSVQTYHLAIFNLSNLQVTSEAIDAFTLDSSGFDGLPYIEQQKIFVYNEKIYFSITSNEYYPDFRQFFNIYDLNGTRESITEDNTYLYNYDDDSLGYHDIFSDRDFLIINVWDISESKRKIRVSDTNNNILYYADSDDYSIFSIANHFVLLTKTYYYKIASLNSNGTITDLFNLTFDSVTNYIKILSMYYDDVLGKLILIFYGYDEGWTEYLSKISIDTTTGNQTQIWRIDYPYSENMYLLGQYCAVDGNGSVFVAGSQYMNAKIISNVGETQTDLDFYGLPAIGADFVVYGKPTGIIKLT